MNNHNKYRRVISDQSALNRWLLLSGRWEGNGRRQEWKVVRELGKIRVEGGKGMEEAKSGRW